MFELTVHFNNNEVYIIEKSKYLTNEILAWFLNADLFAYEKFEEQLNEFLRVLTFSLDGDYRFVGEFNARAYKLQGLLNAIVYEVSKIPLYDQSRYAENHDNDSFIKFLNRHTSLFVLTGVKEHHELYDDPNDDFDVSEDESVYMKYNETYGFHPCDIVEFIPRDFVYDGDEKTDYSGIKLYNEKFVEFLDGYRKVVRDVLSAKKIYEPLINEYLHKHSRFLNEREFSELYRGYLKDNSLSPTGTMKIEYKVMQGKLYESYMFDGLGSFLYIDFFKGVTLNHIPKRCSNCGKYFLLTGGKYTDYCERPLPDDRDKTCRDVGARKKYDDKCKTDPVWLTYNRAYKAHYARYMKKKMTVAEFEAWSAYAIELREKAISGVMGFEEYQEAIRV